MPPAALFAVMLGLALLPGDRLLYPAVDRGRGRHRTTSTLGGRAARVIVGRRPALRRVTVAFAGLAQSTVSTPSTPRPPNWPTRWTPTPAQARWISTDADPGDWLRQYVTGREDLNGTFGLFAEGC